MRDGNGAHGQLNHQVSSFIRRENTVVVLDLAQPYIERLDGVGARDGPADVDGKGEQLDYPRPRARQDRLRSAA